MITIKKLLSLKDDTRKRKYITILREFESQIQNGSSLNIPYLKSLYPLITEDVRDRRLRELLEGDVSLRQINSIRHIVMSDLGLEPGEWDFYSPKDGESERKTFPINLYLEDLRSPFNVGSIFRSSECFGVSNIYTSENCTSPLHKRAIRASMDTVDRVSWSKKSIDEINGPLFALELGGTPINEFCFPESGTVIIGSEELGISPEALKLCDASLGRVTIPMFGNKSSLNVANATSILLQRWSEIINKD